MNTKRRERTIIVRAQKECAKISNHKKPVTNSVYSDKKIFQKSETNKKINYNLFGKKKK